MGERPVGEGGGGACGRVENVDDLHLPLLEEHVPVPVLEVLELHVPVEVEEDEAAPGGYLDGLGWDTGLGYWR